MTESKAAGDPIDASTPKPTSDVTADRKSPPRAPLAFRVGVVGHRPNRLENADLEQSAEVLKTILGIVKKEVFAVQQGDRSLFESGDPALRAISPLAEGTDRIFAEQALAVGFELCCVMPFAQAEFERDFDAKVALEKDSLARFRQLIGQSHTRFELDGCRATEAAAYGAAGRTVLNQSDLLVVVWDGQRESKRGGTEETLDDARRLGVPVVWVDAHAPHHWQMLDATTDLPASAGIRRSPQETDASNSLREFVRAAIELPQPNPTPSAKRHMSDLAVTENPENGLKLYYAELQPRRTIAVVWKVFRDIVGDATIRKVKFSVKPFEESVEADWPRNPVTPVGRIVDRMRPFYAWPDKLAVIYSDRYRSAFILAFFLAAVAVGMALLPFGLKLEPHHTFESLCIVLELFAIFFILCLVIVGRRRWWHERWINYRFAAELVRNLRLVAPIGGKRPLPQIPAQWALYGQPSSTWMVWYVRSLERALGLPDVVINKDYLDNYLDQIGRFVDGQVEFHQVAASRSHRIEKRLHRFAIILLILTLASCGLHLLPSALHLLPKSWHFQPLLDWLPTGALLTFFCGFFPALGAAIAGILNQCEFRRIKMRSESMREQLEFVGKRIVGLRERVKSASDPSQEQFSVPASTLASDLARLLLNEVLDWRVVFMDRPIEQPS